MYFFPDSGHSDWNVRILDLNQLERDHDVNKLICWFFQVRALLPRPTPARPRDLHQEAAKQRPLPCKGRGVRRAERSPVTPHGLDHR